MNYPVMRPTMNERKNAVHSMRDVMVGVLWKSIHEIEKKWKTQYETLRVVEHLMMVDKKRKQFFSDVMKQVRIET